MTNLSVKGLAKRFGALEVLARIDAEFSPGSVTAVLGPSSCGKTTLLKLLGGLEKPDSGMVQGFRDSRISFAFQEPRLLHWLSARDNILFALAGMKDRNEAGQRADRFLAAAGLGEFAGTPPGTLSGGMRRRLSLARAFAFPSDVLLLDEAFSEVDLKLKVSLMDLFIDLWKAEKRTTIFVTHDVRDAMYLSEDILLLSRRPASVLRSFHVPGNPGSRSYGSSETAALEETLYSLILA
jgi:NitT/TauT family transport system ATP-binding protein